MIGMVGTVPGHELTHRTWEPVSLWVGRWLLAFSFDTGFSIEHVYGHHRYVSTLQDPATAPRGRNVYAHIVLSTIRGNISAHRIEAARLRRKGIPVFSGHNAYLRGLGMSAALVAAAFALGGLGAALYFVAAGLWAKALLEVVIQELRPAQRQGIGRHGKSSVSMGNGRCRLPVPGSRSERCGVAATSLARRASLGSDAMYPWEIVS